MEIMLIKSKIDIKKNSDGHLPTELLKFVNNDSYSLLIKGNPGDRQNNFCTNFDG